MAVVDSMNVASLCLLKGPQRTLRCPIYLFECDRNFDNLPCRVRVDYSLILNRKPKNPTLGSLGENLNVRKARSLVSFEDSIEVAWKEPRLSTRHLSQISDMDTIYI